jgi:hypothetical protein
VYKRQGQSAQKDSVYELHFKAKANARLNMSAGFQRNNSPYTYYMGANFTVDTLFQSYKVTFKAPENNSGNLRMWFRFDDNVGDFYIDEVIFKKASTEGLLEKESIEDQNVKRLQLHEINGFTEQRVMDLTEFYANVQIGFLTEMQEFLKDSLGVKAPLAGTNWYVGPEDVYVQNTLDYLDNHAYWDHPNFPNQPWSSTDWTINNSPMMKSPSTTIERLFNGLTVKNKPYTISEYNHGYPNQFQAEMLPMITSYLSFNGADGIMFFTYSGSWDWRADKLDGYFDLHRNHAVMAGFPVFSYVYRNHLIKESGSSVVVNFNKKDVLKMPLEAENGWSTHSPFPNELSYTNKVELTFNEDEPSGLDKLPPVSPGPFILNDGQITWDKKGIFKINTPFFNCISGQLNQNKGTATEQMILESASDFGSIAWLSLVDSALSESSKSLLFIGSKQINTGMIWDGTTTVHNNWGRNPSLIAPNLISVKLKNKSAGLKLTPLDTRGNPVESKTKYFVCDESGYSKILLNPGVDKTVWYAVETVADWSITKTARVEIENHIMCYPNPSTNSVKIKLVYPPGKTFDLIVHDSTGKQVKSEQNQNEFECTKSELGSGMYFFRAIVDNKVYTGNFVLQP